MPDIDAFELRFAGAYRRYLDEADAEVDAAAVARSVAGGTSRRRNTLGWGPWPIRAGAWLVIVAALLVAALAGAYALGTRLPMLPVAPVASEAPTPVPSGWAVLTGTWVTRGAAPTALMLHPCGPGETCGRFERFDDRKELCAYTLEYRPPVGDTFVYWSIDANSFGCGWSGYFQAEFRVSQVTADMVHLSYGPVDGTWRPTWNLSRISDQFEPQLPPTIVGDWYTVGQHERLRLEPCEPGEVCGSLVFMDRGGTDCSFTLMYRPKTYEEFVFWIASASGPPCDANGWAQTALFVRPVTSGEVLVSHPTGVELTFHADGFEPGSSVAP